MFFSLYYNLSKVKFLLISLLMVTSPKIQSVAFILIKMLIVITSR